ncbi:MAG: MFS transporter [Crocinitomix sp.]|nr:MFS transporter [Crocinitomix sp.]
MTTIKAKQKHSKNTAVYSISRALERASFYGVRSLVIMYLVTSTYLIAIDQAFEILGWFLMAIIVSKIIGGFLGDLVLKGKRAVLLGGILQTIGCFVLCIEVFEAVIAGMGLIVLGSGLYAPNILAQFARSYVNKEKIMDAGFSIYYLASNIGAFFGIVLIGLVGERYGWNWGFMVAGGCMLISTSILLFRQEEQVDISSDDSQPKIKNGISLLIICFVAVALFWNLYGLSFIAFQDIQQSISEIHSRDVNVSTWSVLNSYAIMFFAAVAAVVWSYKYYNQLMKMVVGFLLLSLAFGIVLFIQTPYTENATFIALAVSVIIALAEIHISPVLNSIVTRAINPKFLAIAFSITFLPGLIITELLANLKYDYIAQLDNTTILIIGASSLGIIGLTLLILVKLGILKTSYKA